MSYWSDERVEELKALWLSGLTAAQIARHLGVTRNSVIGIVHRRGWTGREGLSGRQALRTYVRAAPKPPPPPPIEEPPAVLEDGTHVTMMQLTKETCRWPIGDPRDSDFHFCGRKAREQSPYCEFHRAQAYQPQPKKRDPRDTNDDDDARDAARNSGMLRALG